MKDFTEQRTKWIKRNLNFPFCRRTVGESSGNLAVVERPVLGTLDQRFNFTWNFFVDCWAQCIFLELASEPAHRYPHKCSLWWRKKLGVCLALWVPPRSVSQVLDPIKKERRTLTISNFHQLWFEAFSSGHDCLDGAASYFTQECLYRGRVVAGPH